MVKIEEKQSFHLDPLEREMERRREKLSKMDTCDLAHIEEIIGFQQAQLGHSRAMDNLAAQKLNSNLRDLCVKKQDTLTSPGKKYLHYGAATLHIIGGLGALGAPAGAWLAIKRLKDS